MNLEILYKSKNAIVIYKPPLMPSQGDASGDKDAMTITSEILKASGEREELYLINRLDRVVGGVMIFARNKKTAKALSESLFRDEFVKEYEEKQNSDIPQEVIELAEKRVLARQNKDWALSDKLRDEILVLGYVVKDSKDGYSLEKK